MFKTIGGGIYIPPPIALVRIVEYIFILYLQYTVNLDRLNCLDYMTKIDMISC